MEFVTVQGHQVPALGYGTFKLQGTACEIGVRQALELGYRHIDTARMYGNEEAVGKGIEATDVDRGDLFVTTKIWRDDLQAPRLKAETELSLRALRMEYVDLLLIHWPHESIPLAESIGAMNDLQAAGKVRHIGVSNFPPSMVEEALRHGRIFANQVEYHPYLNQRKLVRHAQKHDYLLIAYSPLARGDVCDDEILRQIADAHRKTPAQICLRWLLQQDHVAAIPKASSAEHRASNFDIFDFTLNEDEMERINGLNRDERQINPAFSPDWER